LAYFPIYATARAGKVSTEKLMTKPKEFGV